MYEIGVKIQELIAKLFELLFERSNFRAFKKWLTCIKFNDMGAAAGLVCTIVCDTPNYNDYRPSTRGLSSCRSWTITTFSNVSSLFKLYL